MAKQQGTMSSPPSGTVVPERRAADGVKGGPSGGVPGQVGADINIPSDAFDIAHPSVTPGYKPPGRAARP